MTKSQLDKLMTIRNKLQEFKEMSLVSRMLRSREYIEGLMVVIGLVIYQENQYRAGYAAFKSGAGVDKNPFPVGFYTDDARRMWELGWIHSSKSIDIQ